MVLLATNQCFDKIIGTRRISTVKAALPASLVMKAVPPVKTAVHKLTVDTNKPPVNLNDIFPGE